jgi:hypothetical protein
MSYGGSYKGNYVNKCDSFIVELFAPRAPSRLACSIQIIVRTNNVSKTVHYQMVQDQLGRGQAEVEDHITAVPRPEGITPNTLIAPGDSCKSQAESYQPHNCTGVGSAGKMRWRYLHRHAAPGVTSRSSGLGDVC